MCYSEKAGDGPSVVLWATLDYLSDYPTTLMVSNRIAILLYGFYLFLVHLRLRYHLNGFG